MTDGNHILKTALEGGDPVDLNAFTQGVIRVRVAELEAVCLVQDIPFTDEKNVLFAVTGGDVSRLTNGKRYAVAVYDVLLSAEETAS